MIILNGKVVEIEYFPNGESYINSDDLNISDINEIGLKFECESEIASLVFLKGHLDELRVKSSLLLPYMPYSRMDRTEGMKVFTLKYLCRLINSLNFESVVIYEPHSEVCVALLDRVKVINMSSKITEDVLKEVNGLSEPVYLVYPDAGAAKRYEKQISYDKVLTANKERDFKTGYIKKLDINGYVECDKFKAVIVDDLCSKGGTFMLTASKLREMGATEVYLVVTHCEDTIFLGDILKSDLINKVYTTNSILKDKNEKIKIIKVI